MIFKTSSDKETKKIASDLAKKLSSKIIALEGELGAGKTTFTQGFAQGLGIKDKIISPTFVLIRQHQIPSSNKILFHIDLYRLEEPLSISNLGIDEILNSGNYVLIEWAEKMKKDLPKNTTFIKIKKLSLNKRQIEII